MCAACTLGHSVIPLGSTSRLSTFPHSFIHYHLLHPSHLRWPHLKYFSILLRVSFFHLARFLHSPHISLSDSLCTSGHATPLLSTSTSSPHTRHKVCTYYPGFQDPVWPGSCLFLWLYLSHSLGLRYTGCFSVPPPSKLFHTGRPHPLPGIGFP